MSIRRMFGGMGVYHDGLMFALVADGQIYLKCQAETKPAFRDAGCRPFVHESRGKQIEMSYWSMPEAALDDSDALKHWAGMAYDSALRLRKPPPGKSKRGPRA